MEENEIITENTALEPAQAPEQGLAQATEQAPDPNYLKELRDITKKQLVFQSITSLAVLGIFLAILVSVLIMIPKATATLNNIDKVTTEAMNSIKDIDAMVSEMTDTSENLNKLVSDNAEDITGAVDNLSSIDFEGLNSAIKDLEDTVAPMATFFRKFSN
jgi:uncharacterized protein YoxC